MTVSVIVPAYDAAEFLPRCIDALLSQTYGDMQVVLVDDGSSDGTARIVDEAAAHDARVVALHQKNAGPAAARNAGLEAADGEWLMFVDADDTIAPDYVRELLETAQSAWADLVVSDCLIVEDGQERRFGHVRADKVYDSREELFEDFLSDKLPWSLWAKLYAARLFESVRFDADDYIAEDLDVNARILAREGLRVATCANAGYRYHVRAGSVDHSFTARHLGELDVFERVVRLVHERGIDTQASPEAFYEERVLGCLGKALDARALTPEVSEAFRKAISAHRRAVLADPHASRLLKLRLIATFAGPRAFGVVHRIFG